MLAVLGMGKISEKGMMKEGYFKILPSQHNRICLYYSRLGCEYKFLPLKFLILLNQPLGLHHEKSDDIILRMKKDFLPIAIGFWGIALPLRILRTTKRS